MENALMEVGVGGIFAILVIRMVLEFLSKRQSGHKTNGKFTHEDRDMLKDLWNWHNHNDADGVKVWYVRRSLEVAVNRLADGIENLERMTVVSTDVLKEMSQELRDMRRSQVNNRGGD